ncbi:MAG: TetR/AcrR family transcriptional regulator [Thermonemataceae bacterium]
MGNDLENQTEELIKQTAKMLFFTKGHINAKTQEIADEAGVNRALIHYYFRSRDILFEQVLQEELDHTKHYMHRIFTSKDPFKEKVSQFLNTLIDRMIDYPYLENFMVAEIMKDPNKIKQFHAFNEGVKLKDIIEADLKEEIVAGRLKPIKIEHFMANLMGMSAYPMIAKPIMQSIFGFDEIAYKKFLIERKRVIYKSIFDEDLPS